MSLVKNSILLSVAMLAGRGSIVLSGILIANVFGAKAFALFTFCHVTATSISNISMFGLINGIPRFFARMAIDNTVESISRAVLVSFIPILGLLVAGLSVAFVPAEVIGIEDNKKSFLIALILAIGINNLLIGANNGFENYHAIAFAMSAMGFTLLGLLVVMVFFENSIYILPIYVVALFLSILILFLKIMNRFYTTLKQKKLKLKSADVHEVYSFCGPMFCSTVLVNSGVWLAGRSLLGPEIDASAFAVFGLGLQWFGLASMASVIVGKVVLPNMTRNVANNDMQGQKKDLLGAMKISISGSSIIFLLVCIFSPIILQMYGEEFEKAYFSLIMFTAASVISSPISVITSSLIAKGRYRQVLLVVTIWWLSLMVMILIVKGSSPERVVLAVFISYIVYLISVILVYLKSEKNMEFVE
jgi:O-antigen/teichoic acid export membrane protein